MELSTLELARPSVWIEKRTGMKLDPGQKTVLDWIEKYQSICWSRQLGKSTVCAMRAAHEAFTKSGVLVLLFSNSQRQSGEILRKVVDLYNRLLRQEDYMGPRRTNDAAFEFALDNGSRIIGLPGNNESILGYSPSLIIIDEAAVVDDTFFRAVTPMLARSHGTLIVASTPRGKRGFFWNEIWKHEDEVGMGWAMSKITADGSPHIEQKFLEGELKRLGPDWFEQEYFCKFLEVSGSLFTDDQIRAIFTDDGRVVESTEGYEVNLSEDEGGWQIAFDTMGAARAFAT